MATAFFYVKPINHEIKTIFVPLFNTQRGIKTLEEYE
jgi:hypothetical protein